VTGQVGQGALRALPAPPEDDALIAAIRGLLPERSAEDKARGEVPVSFGIGDAADTLRIPVLFSRANREWQDKFRTELRQLFADMESDDTGQVMIGLLSGATEFQVSMLEAYNPQRLSREWVEANLTDEQILTAFLGVTAAAYPFVVQAARALLESREVTRWMRLQLVRLLYSSSTSSSLPSTAGSPSKSKKH
jgi:hypothetical protein